MTWENRGNYSPETWDDNDQSTWTWQIDHIIPDSDFEYESMQDAEFQKSWSLENLRPLNAKQNVLEGTNRTRHTKPRKTIIKIID
jgi:5-methylcytosine-specific restriction endonuclease McrA